MSKAASRRIHRFETALGTDVRCGAEIIAALRAFPGPPTADDQRIVPGFLDPDDEAQSNVRHEVSEANPVKRRNPTFEVSVVSIAFEYVKFTALVVKNPARPQVNSPISQKHF
jgi:hypothetical protein